MEKDKIKQRVGEPGGEGNEESMNIRGQRMNKKKGERGELHKEKEKRERR